MAQSLEVNIKTTSDVPQAMDKAKAATNSFGSQVEAIGRKFGRSFKDIFLSFLGPMAILTTMLALIGKMIADNQRKREDAHQAALNDTNELMSAEDRYYEKKKANEKKDKETKEQAKLTREEVTRDFLRNDPRGQAIVNKYQLPPLFPTLLGAIRGKEQSIDTSGMLAGSKGIQDQVQAFLASDIVKTPGINAALTGPTALKDSPLGSGVIGVGASPQITLAMEANTKLDSIDSKLGELVNAGIATDPTKPLNRKFPIYSPGMSR